MIQCLARNVKRTAACYSIYFPPYSGYFWLGLVFYALGTFILVLIGCGTCLGGTTAVDGTAPVSWEKAEPTKVQISLAFGLAVATAVWNLAHVSGGHVNPAVTVAMLCARRISVVRAALYMFAQCAAVPVAGTAALAGLTPAALHGGLGTTTVDAELTKQQEFDVENGHHLRRGADRVRLAVDRS